jgi:hypothetical protein
MVMLYQSISFWHLHVCVLVCVCACLCVCVCVCVVYFLFCFCCFKSILVCFSSVFELMSWILQHRFPIPHNVYKKCVCTFSSFVSHYPFIIPKLFCSFCFWVMAFFCVSALYSAWCWALLACSWPLPFFFFFPPWSNLPVTLSWAGSRQPLPPSHRSLPLPPLATAAATSLPRLLPLVDRGRHGETRTAPWAMGLPKFPYSGLHLPSPAKKTRRHKPLGDLAARTSLLKNG